MESIPSIKEEDTKKYIFDINDANIENEYCPHILSHYLNPYLDSQYIKIDFSSNGQTTPSHVNLSESKTDKEKEKQIYYSTNLSNIIDPFKSFKYYNYNQSKNIFNTFLLKNYTLDHLFLNNPQNLSINSMNREGCIFSMNFNDTGNLMATSNHKHFLEIWDLKTKKLAHNITAHSEIVTDCEFFHGKEDNEYFLSCSLDKTIKLFKNYKNVHTFIEHNDWVKCLAVRRDNQQFISGCVSSVVKLWDIPTQRVIGSVINTNDDPNTLTTVNSLRFLNKEDNIFMIGLRSGEVKIFDTRLPGNNRMKNVGLAQSFKAHDRKLNTIKINQTDKYLLTSSRDSSLRLWDLRRLPKENESEESIKKNKYYVNEYNKHKCVGYNIECNFYNNDQYIITGSENNHFYIYDIFNINSYYKFKTKLKCINLIKQIPNTYSIAFTGLEDISVFIWNAHKNITKFYEKKYLPNKMNINNDINSDDSEGDKDFDEIEETDKNNQVCNKLIEEIMSECGDMILRIFHMHNLTYSNGINFESLIEIIKKSRDQKSEELIKNIQEKFMNKIVNNFINGTKQTQEGQETKNEKKGEKGKIFQKRKINCLECQKKESNIKYKDVLNKDNNIFNSIERTQLKELLNLPNKYDFNIMKEKKNDKKALLNNE